MKGGNSMRKNKTFTGVISGAVIGGIVSSMLTLGIVSYKDVPDSYDSAISAETTYSDFDATQTLDAVEATLCEEIIEKLCEDIFNGTVANW